MQMLRQDDNGINTEGMSLLDPTEYQPQRINIIYQQAISTSLGTIHGEEITCAFLIWSAVGGHGSFPDFDAEFH